MNEWNIQSRAHACGVCAQPFADKQSYRTLLFELPQELRRSDICEPCAEKAGDVRQQAGFISQWHGVYEPPPAQPVEAIQKATAETILRQLVEQNDPRYAPAAYILAVMLERKRLLKVKEQVRRNGRRFFVYEQPKTGDVFTIADPNLHLSQLEAVQQDVADLLEHGLPATVTPPASASDETPAAETSPEAIPEAIPEAVPETALDAALVAPAETLAPVATTGN